MILTDEQRMAAELGMDVDNPFGRGSTSTSEIQEYRFGGGLKVASLIG